MADAHDASSFTTRCAGHYADASEALRDVSRAAPPACTSTLKYMERLSRCDVTQEQFLRMTAALFYMASSNMSPTNIHAALERHIEDMPRMAMHDEREAAAEEEEDEEEEEVDSMPDGPTTSVAASSSHVCKKRPSHNPTSFHKRPAYASDFEGTRQQFLLLGRNMRCCGMVWNLCFGLTWQECLRLLSPQATERVMGELRALAYMDGSRFGHLQTLGMVASKFAEVVRVFAATTSGEWITFVRIDQLPEVPPVRRAEYVQKTQRDSTATSSQSLATHISGPAAEAFDFVRRAPYPAIDWPPSLIDARGTMTPTLVHAEVGAVARVNAKHQIIGAVHDGTYEMHMVQFVVLSGIEPASDSSDPQVIFRRAPFAIVYPKRIV